MNNLCCQLALAALTGCYLTSMAQAQAGGWH
jgi:hypothetical protein